MKRDTPPGTVRPLFQVSAELPPPPEVEQEIGDRKSEAQRVVNRLATIVEDHRQAALPLNIELGAEDLSFVLGALREHAKGGPGTPVSGARDEIHGYCLNRLFDELVEEPSNILFTSKISAEVTRYDAMSAAFWIECLDLFEATYSSPKES